MVNTALAQAPIGNGQTLNADAARYYNALVKKIKDETGIVIVATEGTRSYARQLELYNGYRQGRIDPSTGRRYNPAWSPNDSRAYHLSGRAVDVGSGVGYVATQAAKVWRAACGKYGFRETVPGEPWHFEWRADWVKATIDGASASEVVIPDKFKKENNMLRFITENTETAWYVTDGTTKMVVTQAEAQQYVDCGLAVYEEKGGQKVNIAPLLIKRIPGE